MEPFVKLITVLLLTISPVLSGPIQQQEWSTHNAVTSLGGHASHCASRCTPDPRFVRFDSGKSYFYKLKTQTYLEEGPSQPETPLSLEASLIINSFGNCDLELQLVDTKIEGVAKHDYLRLKSELESTPLRFGYSDGYVTDVCYDDASESESVSDWSLNVKKALVSAFQMTSQSLTKESIVFERDFQGLCQTMYRPMSDRFGKYVIKKTKNLQYCDDRQEFMNGFYPKYYLNHLKSIPLINGSLECIQTFGSDLINGITCYETQHVLFTRGQYGLRSELSLIFERQEDNQQIQRNVHQKTYRRHRNHLKMSSPQERQYSSGSLQTIISDLCHSIDSQSEDRDSNQRLISRLFSQLIQKMNKNSEEIQKTYEMLESGRGLVSSCGRGQQRVRDLFLDACAQSGSEGGAKVLKQWIQRNRKSIKTPFLFQSLSFSSEPEVKALEPLVDVLEQNSDEKHVLYGITGFIHNLKHVSQQTRDNQLLTRGIERAINALVKVITSGSSDDFQKIIAIKGLQNIGLERNARARQQMALLLDKNEIKDGVKVAIIQLLSDVMGREERPLVMRVFENERNSNELRLLSYKALLMTGSERQEMQRIKHVLQSTNNKDVQQYVRSHVQNMRETSDPHKKDVIRDFSDVITEQPMSQWFGLSNYFETSFMFDALGVGAVIESDVIYDQKEDYKVIPTLFTVNTSLPLFGRELNLIELQFRQKGIQNMFKKEIFEKLFQNSEKDYKKFVQNVFQFVNTWKNSVHAQNAFLEVHVKIDGKHVFSYNSRANERSYNLMEFFSQFAKQTTDGALALQAINTRVHLPTSSGWPLVARVNSTLVTQWKPRGAQRHVTFNPSFVWETEAGLELLANERQGGGHREVGVAFSVESDPIFDSIIDYSEKSIDFKVFVPKEKIILFKTEMELIRTGRQGYQSGSDWIKCSQWTKKPLGIEFCVEKSSKKFEIFVRKSDKSLTSYDLHVTRDYMNYHVLFQTPSSDIERRFEIQLVLNENEIKFNLDFNPFVQKIEFLGSVKRDNNQESIEWNVSHNGRQELSGIVGVEHVQKGQKREYRPRVKLTFKGQELVNVLGSVSVMKGRKNQLMINLEGNQKQFLKGSLVREGEKSSKDLRLSSDLSLNLLNGFEMKFISLFDKSQKHVTSDLQLDYKVNSHARKESLKTSFKIQDLSQNPLNAKKFSTFGEIIFTQFPQWNSHLAYNLLNKMNEHVENELTFQWSERLGKKIHVLQVMKATPSGQNGQHLENTLNVLISPLNIDYELRANGEMTSQQQVSVDVTGKDRNNRKENDFKASVAYKHVSRAPLHLTLDANLKTYEREYIYQDDLREMDSNGGEYRGKTSVQWANSLSERPLKKMSMDYHYRIKSSPKDLHHEMDVEVTSPWAKHIKHSALLRMSRDDSHIKSRLLIGGEENHLFESQFNRFGKNSIQWAGLGYGVNAHLHPYVLPQKAGLEVTTPTQWYHKTDLEIVPKNSFRLKSDTKSGNENLFAFESDLSRRNPSKIRFNTKSFDGSLDYSKGTGNEGHVTQLVLNNGLNDWTHSSTLRAVPSEKTMTIESKTISKNSPILTLNSELKNGKKSFVSIELPLKKTSIQLNGNGIHFYGNGNQNPINRKWAKVDINCGQNFRHSSEYSEPEPEVKTFVSRQSDFRSGLPLYSVDYKYNKGSHELSSDLQNYLLSGHLRPREDHVFQWNLKNQKKDLNSLINIHRNGDKISFDSQFRNFGQNLAQISGHLVTKDLTSQLDCDLPRAQTRASFSYNPNQSETRIKFSSPEVREHVTSLEFPENKYSFDSKTTLNNNNYYSLAGSHSPNRKSFVSLKTPLYDVSGHFDQSQWENPSLKISAQTPRVSHVTEVSANRNRKDIRVESRTDRKSRNGPEMENLYSLEGNYYHLNQEIPSNLAIKVSKNLKINSKVIPFGTGSRYLNVQLEHPEYGQHVTELGLNALNHVTLKSRTNDIKGRNLAKIDSFLPMGPQFQQEKSHVTFVSAVNEANLEFNPKKKSILFQLKNGDKWRHKSEITPLEDAFDGNSLSNGYSLKSQTKRFNENYFDLNSNLNQKQKQFYINFKTPSVEHETRVTRADHVFALDSQTLRDKRLMNKMVVNPEKVTMEHYGDHYETKAHWSNGLAHDGSDYSPMMASVEYKSKIPLGRHILAMSQYDRSNNGKFSFDISWDQQRDENQRFKLEFEARDANQRSVHVLSMFYAGNEVIVTSDVNKRHVLYGPNTWSVQYVPKYEKARDSLELKVSHVLSEKEKEMKCKVEYLEGMAEKLSLLWSNQMIRGDEEYSSGVLSSLQITSAANPDLNLKVSLRTRVQSLKRFMTEIKALKQNTNQEYALSWHVAREQHSSNGDDVIRGEGVVETPTMGRKELNFVLNSNQNSIEFNAKSVEKKLLELKAKYLTTRGKHVTLDLKSNVREIPSVSVSGDYYPLKELSLRVDIDGQRKAEVSLVRTGSEDYRTGSEINFRFETDFWPKFETKMNYLWNSSQKELEFISKWDSKEVFSTLISAKRAGSGIWTGSARMSGNGVQLAHLALEEVLGPKNSFEYIIRAQNGKNIIFHDGLKAFFSIQHNSGEKVTKIAINLSKEQQNYKYLNLDVTWKARASSHVSIPERIEVLAEVINGNRIEFKTSFNEELNDRSSGQSVLGVTSGQIRRHLKNELSFSINSHKISFEEQSIKRSRDSQEIILLIEFPNGKQTEVKSDANYDSTSGQYLWKTEVKDNERQKQLFSSEMVFKETERELKTLFKFKISDKRQKFIDFWFEKPSKELKIDFKSKLIFDLTEKENNFLTLLTEVERRPEVSGNKPIKSGFFYSGTGNNNLNTTFLIQLQSRDPKKLDFTLKAHASSQTVGVAFNNLNRNGRRQWAHLFVQSEESTGEERRFQGIFSTNEKRYRVEGAWLNKNNELSLKVKDERSGQWSDVRASVQNSCVTWETRVSEPEKRFKYDFCLNFKNKFDKSYELSLEETSSEGKTKHFSANIEVDTRSERSVKIDVDWSPQWVQQWYNGQSMTHYTSQWWNNNNNYAKEVFEELIQELTQKWRLLSSDQLLRPLFVVSDEIQDIFEELMKSFKPFEHLLEFEFNFEKKFYLISDSLKNDFWRPLTRNSRKMCQKYEICYKLLYGLEKYGFDSIIDYLQWNSIRLLKESHRILVSTSGQLYQRLSQLPVPQWLSDYRQSFGYWVQSIIESNETIKSIYDSINRLMREVVKDWDQINGQEVKKSFNDIFLTIFDVQTQRVFLWDPQRGRMSLEMRETPLLRRGFRSIGQKSN